VTLALLVIAKCSVRQQKVQQQQGNAHVRDHPSLVSNIRWPIYLGNLMFVASTIGAHGTIIAMAVQHMLAAGAGSSTTIPALVENIFKS
jgi:hypothetical protein